MNEIILEATQYINSHVAYAPYLIFSLLILAGFNIPVSEDLMLFTSGVLAAKNPEYKTHLFFGVFLGAYLSDIICYLFFGRYLGPKIFKIQFFSNLITKERLEKMISFYKRFGVLTLIIGRFIPFGVRNALFISAGFSKMDCLKFCLADGIACLMSSILFFNLYFEFGESIIDTIKQGNIILFSLVMSIALFYFIKQKATKKIKSK